jgi:methionyl-tRNA formyltransferase
MTRVIYIGTDVETLLLLEKSKHQIIGVSKLNFLLKIEFNPVNVLLSIIYFLNTKEIFINANLLSKASFLKKFATSYKKKYFDYIFSINNNKIIIFDFDKESIEADTKKYSIDLFIVNVWGMLDRTILQIPKIGVLNIHPSKLPEYRGALPTLWSLKNNDKISAVSIILLNSSADEGNIVYQECFSIHDNWNCLDIEREVSKIVKNNLNRVIDEFIDGSLQPIAQTGNVSVTAKYLDYQKIEFFKETSFEIFNKIKLYPLLDPYTYCYIEVGTKKIELYSAQFKDYKNSQYVIDAKLCFSAINITYADNQGEISFKLFKDISVYNSLYLLFFKKKLFPLSEQYHIE